MKNAACVALGFSLGLMSLAGVAAAQQHTAQESPPKTVWNVWLDTRLAGISDAVSQQRSLGVYSTLGADTTVTPWLTLGLGVGYENLETRSTALASARTVENGLGLQPYATARLTPNLFLTAFGSLTRLWYSTVLAPGVAGQFDAWRWVAGGSLSGVWHQDAWRLQPVLTVLYGTENQNSYTTNVGSSVAAQQIPFGRISLGPEIGYAFTGPAKDWALEPYITARGNYDFVTTNSVIFNGATFATGQRGQWSASLGAGAQLNTQRGFFAKLQASYETIGMQGLDIWLGQVRGGWRF